MTTPIETQQSAVTDSLSTLGSIYGQTKENLSPFITAGTGALDGMSTFKPSTATQGAFNALQGANTSVAVPQALTPNMTSQNAGLTLPEVPNFDSLNTNIGINQTNPNISMAQTDPNIKFNPSANPNIGFSGGGNANINLAGLNPNIEINYQDIIDNPLYQFANEQASEQARRSLATQGMTGSSHAANILGDVGMRVASEYDDKLYNRGADNFNRDFGMRQADYMADAANADRSLQAGIARYNAESDNFSRNYQMDRDAYNADLGNYDRQYQQNADAYNVDLGNYNRGYQQNLDAYNADVANYNRADKRLSDLYNMNADNYSRQYQQGAYLDAFNTDSNNTQYNRSIDQYNMQNQQQDRAIANNTNLFNLAKAQDQADWQRKATLATLGQNAGVNAANYGSDYANSYTNLLTGMANAQASQQMTKDLYGDQLDQANKNSLYNLGGTILNNSDKIVDGVNWLGEATGWW